MATILDIHRGEPTTASPFPDTPYTAAEHFRMAYYAAVSVVWEQVVEACQDREAALAEFPFLRKYAERLEAFAGRRPRLSGWWLGSLRAWERSGPAGLPIRRLREGALVDDAALAFLFAAGLAEEDPSFGALFEVAQARPGVRRPTAGLLHAWWRNAFPERDGRAVGRELVDLGLLRRGEATPGDPDQAYEVPAVVWDALRGVIADHPLPGWRFEPVDRLPNVSGLILPGAVHRQVAAIVPLLESGAIQALAVRGPGRNGRSTLLRGIARELGQGALVLDQAAVADREAARLVGPVATMLGAMPIFRFDLFAGEQAVLPAFAGYRGPVGIVLGHHGGIAGERLDRLYTIELAVPDEATMRRHWAAERETRGAIDVDDASRRLRLTSGNIRRLAALAPAHAAVAGRSEVTAEDLRTASRALNRQALDNLAILLPPAPDLDRLAVRDETKIELGHLIRRCRHRDALRDVLGEAFASQPNHGVRALFTGPSGTGKTFAARLLATELGVDLYRIDLAAVVDKYIGETEKNLGKLFAHAEELDVMLLLDEGDALLGERSAVHNATDRYANLETNYLLQRLETFDGILVITTNAGDRIDRAFERRMDVVVTFQLPEARERAAIWRSHLPANRDLSDALLDQAAHYYRLSGGQIRNAALHAALLAMDEGGVVTAAHLDAAIQREYRKLGRIAPALEGDDARERGRDG